MGDPPNLGRWLWALRVALVLATIGAVVLARRRRDYTPIALALSWVSFAHLVRGLLAVFVLGAGPPGGVPYQVAGEVDRAHAARAREPHDLEARFHDLAGLHPAQDSEARQVMTSYGSERGGG